MIVGELSAIDEYGYYSTDIQKGLIFIKTLSPDIPVGTYTINERSYANVMEYNTVKESNLGYEAHRKYLDIHYVLRGREIIKWKPVDGMTTKTPYDTEKDAAFFDSQEPEKGLILLENNRYAIMFPKDGHSCQYSVGDSEIIKKIVVKIKIDE